LLIFADGIIFCCLLLELFVGIVFLLKYLLLLFVVIMCCWCYLFLILFFVIHTKNLGSCNQLFDPHLGANFMRTPVTAH